MADPLISYEVVPVGGAIALSMACSGATTLTRTVSGGSPVTLYSGNQILYYLDTGDQLPAPLDPTLNYTYTLTDVNGSVSTGYIQPATSLNIDQEPLTQILMRLLQAGVNSLVVPAGLKRAQVLQAMPIAGVPAMPFVTINQDLLQQEEVPIGQSVLQPVDNSWTITGFCKRMYRVSILSTSGQERDFYRDAIVGIFESIYQSVLQKIGIDVHHEYQVASGQVARDLDGMSPGFYYSECLLTFVGTLNVTITCNYGIISTIKTDSTGAEGSNTNTEVPNTSE